MRADSTRRWVERTCGARLLRADPLVGGTTSDVRRLVLDGPPDTAVLRCWTDTAPWTDGLVEREAAALEALSGRDLGAPELIAADPSGAQAGVRCLLMTERPGTVDLAPADLQAWLDSLAERQAAIHRLDPVLSAPAPGWFTPARDRSWIADRGLRDEALAVATGPEAPQPVFAHGDYQHFNTLWTAGRVTGIVDWPMAGTGPRGIDVGHCLLNLTCLFTAEAAARYLRTYERAAGITVDRAPLLRALLCWDPVWPDGLDRQIAGRARLVRAGLPDRVVESIRRTLRSR